MQAVRVSGIAVMLLGVSVGVSGCQLCGITERYQDVIDHIADRSPHLDRWYHPQWDVSRIGQPDWYQSAWNQHWVSPEHVRGLRTLPDYPHNPLYIQPQIPPEPRPIPDASQLTPEAIPAEDPAMPARPGDQLGPIRDPQQMEEGTRLLPPLPTQPLVPPSPGLLTPPDSTNIPLPPNN